MIEYFDYFFGGHVEMTDMGFNGKRVDDRIESDEYLATVFDEALSLARLIRCGWRSTIFSARAMGASATYRC
mgnify:CR=1 FL=1